MKSKEKKSENHRRFACLLFTLLVREGLCPGVMGVAKHIAPNTGKMRLVAVYCSGKEDTDPPELSKSCTWEQSEQCMSRGWGTGFVVTRGWSASWILQEDMIGLSK